LSNGSLLATYARSSASSNRRKRTVVVATKAVSRPSSVRRMHTPVNTSCAFPRSRRNIVSASPGSAGLPRTRLPTTTAVSAASSRPARSGAPSRSLAARALVRARRSTISLGVSPGREDSRTIAGTTTGEIPIWSSRLKRRGDAEAR